MGSWRPDAGRAAARASAAPQQQSSEETARRTSEPHNAAEVNTIARKLVPQRSVEADHPVERRRGPQLAHAAQRLPDPGHRLSHAAREVRRHRSIRRQHPARPHAGRGGGALRSEAANVLGMNHSARDRHRQAQRRRRPRDERPEHGRLQHGPERPLCRAPAVRRAAGRHRGPRREHDQRGRRPANRGEDQGRAHRRPRGSDGAPRRPGRQRAQLRHAEWSGWGRVFPAASIWTFPARSRAGLWTKVPSRAPVPSASVRVGPSMQERIGEHEPSAR